jgi:hypothetical protein
MFTELSFQMARTIIDDRLKDAADRRLPASEPEPSTRIVAKARARALVRDSILLSRRAYPPAERD